MITQASNVFLDVSRRPCRHKPLAGLTTQCNVNFHVAMQQHCCGLYYTVLEATKGQHEVWPVMSIVEVPVDPSWQMRHRKSLGIKHAPASLIPSPFRLDLPYQWPASSFLSLGSCPCCLLSYVRVGWQCVWVCVRERCALLTYIGLKLCKMLQKCEGEVRAFLTTV